MSFAAASKEKITSYLGYPLNDAELDYVGSALSQIENLTDSTASNNAIARIEAWLTQLDTISTNIDTERDIEGTTKLPNLRYEGRRLVALVGNAMGLEVRFDVFSSAVSES